MKVIIVTSEVTYVKDNYYQFLKTLIDYSKKTNEFEISAIVLIKTISLSLILKAISLFFVGAINFSFTLLKNIFFALFYDKRIKYCKKNNILVLKFQNINNDDAILKLKELMPDIIVNARTRNIYKKNVLEIPTIGCINIHHGILPKNRGTMCDLWAFYENNPVGFTIHFMNEKIDDGNIIKVCHIDVSGIKKYIDIPMKSSLIEATTLIDVIKLIKQNGKNVGYLNKSDDIKYTKNPDIKTIFKMLFKGIRL